MNFMMKCARLLVLLTPVFALPTTAHATHAHLRQPGSVIVYPKWTSGTVIVDGVRLPRTEIEVGALCPNGDICPEHQPIKIRFHWVCPGSDDVTFKYICKSTDFDVFLTVDGKAVFNPELISLAGDLVQKTVHGPGFNADGTLCTRGYLIGYVIDTSDRPIKYDGLIGDAVLRVSSTAVQAYSAVTIQADPALASGAAITLDSEGGLVFDSGAGHYLKVTGQIFGDVKYDDPGPPTTVSTSLSLLTLDVRQGLSNNPVFVDLSFWTEDEIIESTQVHFICYGQFNLSTKIDPNLTADIMGRKGVFQSTQAIKQPFAGSPDPKIGDVPLIGLVHTVEGPPANPMARSYILTPYNNSVGVPATFAP